LPGGRDRGWLKTVIRIRRASEIHAASGGWFEARWHFSFDDYVDPEHDHLGPLRVFNDDRLVPGAAWPLHPHRDVEGLTYVAEGLFGHEDNVGGPFGPLPAGSVQRMTLGAGAWHSERNASQTEPLRFIQIWILPDVAGLEPRVEQRVFSRHDRTNRLLQVFAPAREMPEGGSPAHLAGRDGVGPVAVHQDVAVFIASLEPDAGVRRPVAPGRGLYAYVIDGAATFNGLAVTAGDAATVTDEDALLIGGRRHEGRDQRAEAGAPPTQEIVPRAEPSAARADQRAPRADQRAPRADQRAPRAELIVVDVPLAFEPVGIWAGRVQGG
jgi:quercetin 2,3-dioxygenase